MSLFANLNNDGLEESQDRLGGYQALESGIYTGKIKAAYGGQSDSGAKFVSIIVDLGGDTEYRETIYITNKAGENFYIGKKDGKKYAMPGFTTIDDLCLVTSGKPLSEQLTEEKVIKLYDTDAKKELPKAVPMLVDLLGLQVTLGILKQVESQTEKASDGTYVPKADGSTRTKNTISKVFHTETKMTVAEARQGAEAAKFHDQWEARNKGVTQNLVKDAPGVQSGAPVRPGAPATPPQAGSAAPRKSLFSK